LSRINPDHLAAVIPLINQGPFFRHLSLKILELGPGFSKLEVELGPQHLNPFGVLHGGVFSSALDTAAYWSAYCDLKEGAGIVSLDLTVNFLAPVRKGRLIVQGRLIRTGRSIFLTEAEARDPDRKLAAQGSSKLMVIPGRQTMDQVRDTVGGSRLPPKFLSS
jgi:uncharacterized protein (TIGR00369 family)